MRGSSGRERVYLDANVFVYADLAVDELGADARRVIAALLDRKFRAGTCCLTVDEVLWSIWLHADRARAVRVARAIMSLPGLEIFGLSRDHMRAAVENIETHGLKPRDAIHLASMSASDVKTIVTEDADFDKIPEIKRLSISKFVKGLGAR
jgi:hypothetical protein